VRRDAVRSYLSWMCDMDWRCVSNGKVQRAAPN
jgi:hypothetical protein